MLPDGRTLLQASVALYASAFPHLIVVMRPEDVELARAVRLAAGATPVQVAFCEQARLGMGSSLAGGATAAAAAGWDGLFVALADMPWIRPATLERLRAARAAAPEGAVVQPVFRDRPGHPVGFPRVCFAALQGLAGDEGARHVARAAPGGIHAVAVDDPGVLMDMDRPPGSAPD